jgi:hypothetical protein
LRNRSIRKSSQEGKIDDNHTDKSDPSEFINIAKSGQIQRDFGKILEIPKTNQNSAFGGRDRFFIYGVFGARFFTLLYR